MGAQVEILSTQKWLRLGQGLTFKVTEASVRVEALKSQLGAALDSTGAVNTGDLILLPIIPYLYETLDKELAIANSVMVGDSLSHLRLAPAQRLHVYWIEDIEQALCAQTYFDNLLPVQLSDRRKQLAIVKKADGVEIKRLTTVIGTELVERELNKIAARPLKHMLGKVKENDIRKYREERRVSGPVSKPKKETKPKTTTPNNYAEHASTSAPKSKPTTKLQPAQLEPELGDLFAEPESVEAPNPVNGLCDNGIEPLAQQNWDRLGVEDTLQLNLSEMLSELGTTHTQAQLAKAQDLIKIYPAATHSDSKSVAVQLCDELTAQCGINTDSIKRRI